jgi:hypothetical protein
MDPEEPSAIEVPEDDIEIAPVLSGPGSQLDPVKVERYFVNGGLIAILLSNTSGGRNQPRAWLCLDNLGNVTHTFIPDRGVVGGETVPFWAVQDGKILAPKRNEVLSFLTSFGLSDDEAEKVLKSVGTTR